MRSGWARMGGGECRGEVSIRFLHEKADAVWEQDSFGWGVKTQPQNRMPQMIVRGHQLRCVHDVGGALHV